MVEDLEAPRPACTGPPSACRRADCPGSPDGGRRRPSPGRWPRSPRPRRSRRAAAAGAGCRGSTRIGIDRADGARAASACVQPLREEVVARRDADLLGRSPLVADVDLRGGSSPTSTTASVGRTPVDSRSAATLGLTPASTLAATALPSRICATAAARLRRDRTAHALDRERAPRLGIDADHGAVERGRPLGGLEAIRHLGQEALQRQLRLHADHGVGGPGQARGR